MSSERTTPASDTLMLSVVLGPGGLVLTGWAGAAVTAVLSGHPVPRPDPAALVAAVTTHWGDPSAAWGQPIGPAWLYWTATGAVLAITAGAATTVWWAFSRRETDPADARHPVRGVASRREAAKVAGHRALSRRAATLRPSLPHPVVADLGHPLGRCRGATCYASVEDSMVLLGPPRSGKGLHVVINAILDAPGAVVTTSTRPDNLTATLAARSTIGPVAVFDPQRLAPGIPTATRWSPIRGCENPHTALVRAKALTSGAAKGTTDASFWQSSAEQAVRCLLHAAALGGCTTADLYRWSLSANQAREAVIILTTHPAATTAWDKALESIVTADVKQRDSVWAMVGIAFAALADPDVLDALSPGPAERFDPQEFLRERGTVYLVGTSTGAAATAGLVGAFVEDVAEAARRLAAASPGARLDPPMSMILDEAANYPLPSLGSLMSDGGGTGIATMTVLQSLAQARAVWGEHAAGAIWDAAIVKLVLGGGSNARDLDDLSKLVGTRRDEQHSHSVSADGARTRSTSTHQVPVMEPSRLRMLPFGTGILLLRSAKPILLTLSAWTDRPAARDLQHSRDQLEATIQQAHVARARQAPGIPSRFGASAGMPGLTDPTKHSPLS